jgi:glycosyltransferase involved in cell wall biosynthesis
MEQELSQMDDSSLIILNDRSSKGGPGRYAEQLFRASQTFSQLVSVIWNESEIDKDFSGKVFAPLHGLKFRTLTGFPNYGRKLFPQLLMRNYYQFISHAKKHGKRVHYSSQLILPISPDDEDIVSILDLIALDEFKKQPINNYIVRRFLKFDNILTISDVVSEQIKRFRSDAKPVTIHPYVSGDFHRINKKEGRNLLKIPEGKKVILNVSSVQPRKNIKVIKETIEALGNNYLLVHVGPDIGVGLNLQNVSDSLLNLVYNAADLFLFPTLNEGFGYPLIEAMACGVPIISSDIPIVREVTDGTAVLTNPLSVTEIVAAIKNLDGFSDDIIQKEILRAKHFTFERFRSELLSYYKTIGMFNE